MRFCKAFPPLIEDVVGLLLQYGRIAASEASLKPISCSPTHTTDLTEATEEDDLVKAIKGHANDLSLPDQVRATFEAILENSVLEKRLY